MRRRGYGRWTPLEGSFRHCEENKNRQRSDQGGRNVVDSPPVIVDSDQTRKYDAKGDSRGQCGSITTTLV